MTARVTVAVILSSAVLLASVESHVLVAALGIPTKAATGQRRFGKVNQPAQGLISGSSITYDAVDWNEVADLVGVTIESWPVPGSSPAEWEQLQRRSPHAKTTFVGVSLYDLNEGWLCDFRADIVPLNQTLMDLWSGGSDIALARRVSSLYPRTWVRTLFPAVGRSEAVMSGLRDRARNLVGSGDGDLDSDGKLRLAADYTSDDRISDWPEDRLLRRLATMRGVQGKQSFSGPKHLALRRLLNQARRQGAVTVIVLPVSPPYGAGLLSQADVRQFEASLVKESQFEPEAKWVRLDHLPSLNSPDYFYDLVHLNMQGRHIATDALLKALAQTSTKQ